MVDLNGTKLETADTAKENLQPIGTPLLGEMQLGVLRLGLLQVRTPRDLSHSSPSISTKLL
jgi:hypothetical protein